MRRSTTTRCMASGRPLVREQATHPTVFPSKLASGFNAGRAPPSPGSAA